MKSKGKSKQRIVLAILGVVLIFVGLAPALQQFVTLIIDTAPPQFSLTGSYPSSDNQAAPSIISQIGTATDFWILARDATSGIDLVFLRCVSTDGVFDSGIVTLSKDAETFPLGNLDWQVWRWAAPPLSADKIYQFTWSATDRVGKTASLNTWGCYGDSDGVFSINGQPITSTDAVIYLGSRTIGVKFVASKNAGAITSISVMIFSKDGTTTLKSAKLTKVDSSTWQTDSFYTFDSDGYYVLKGYIDMSTKSVLKMNILQQIGEPSEWTLLNFVAVLAGLVFVYFGYKKR